MASKKKPVLQKIKNYPTKSKGIPVLQNKNKDKKSGGAFAPPILQKLIAVVMSYFEKVIFLAFFFATINRKFKLNFKIVVVKVTINFIVRI